MKKSSDKVIISGTGCALADFLYTNVRFDDPAFMQYLSKQAGDGGLCPGKLVFKEDLEQYTGDLFEEILVQIVGKRKPDAFNTGGPGLVSLIHVAQMLGLNEFETRFYGVAGNDETSKMIYKTLGNSKLDYSNYITVEGGSTPSTVVFSDPGYANGSGERSFVNTLGVAAIYTPDMLAPDFFDADIICFGGTALVPAIHDNLDVLLHLAKNKDCVTIVNTVYDFRSEKRNPGSPWPLVQRSNYSLIDLLIMDKEEALRISGAHHMEEAVNFFIQSGVQAFIVTNGASKITVYSKEGLFLPTGQPMHLPVSQKASFDFNRISPEQRDTTGCGDNFAGGVIASVAKQLKLKHKGNLSLIEASSWGVVSGGFACSYAGGVCFEKHTGEKRSKITDLFNAYQIQLSEV